MFNAGTDLIGLILVLGVLIFVHEAGHFLVAKAFGVRILVFSFGFGKRLFGFRKGDTDYRVSLIPLGGYVRMAGDTPDDATPIVATGAPDEFLSKPKWQRLLILFAGPAMNIVIAIAFLAIPPMIGTEYPLIQPVIARVLLPGAAARAGLQPGDRIIRIGNETIADYDDLKLAISMNPGTPLHVEYIRKGHRFATTMTPDRENGEYGTIGRAGIYPWINPIVGRVLPRTIAAEQHVQPGDRIASVNGKPVNDLNDVLEVVEKAPKAALRLGLARGDGKVYTLAVPAGTMDERTGFGSIGIIPPTVIRKMTLGPALEDSVQENWKMLRYAGTAIRRIFRNEASVKETFTGPWSMARISGAMLRTSWLNVIGLMAMISLQLGVMNLLPIPVLDGGHIAILVVEGAARRDLSFHAKERIQQVGFAVLAALMIVVLFNDVVSNIARLATHG